MISKTETKEILVYADWRGLPEPAFMETLGVTPVRGKGDVWHEAALKYRFQKQNRIVWRLLF